MTLAHHIGEDGALRPHPSEFDRGPLHYIRMIVSGWALVGGFVIAALVLITAYSALGNLFFSRPFAGEYELAKHLVGIAIFAFLPYCQLTGSNVTVDIFTEKASERTKAAMLMLSSLLAIAFSIILLVQMSKGFGDYLRYPEVTAALKIPLWTAFPPILVSLALLLIASVVTLYEGWLGLTGRAPAPVAAPTQH